MDEISSEMKTIPQIFTDENLQFTIPGFQRSFVWTRNDVRDMFSDFAEDTKDFSVKTDSLSGYLLGNIVLIKSNREYITVDGQQRLTTLSLMYKAISNRYSEMAENEGKQGVIRLAGGINAATEILNITNDDGDSVGYRIQYDSSLKYAQTYNDILADKLDSESTEKQELQESESNLIDVWEEINSQISSLSDMEFNRFVTYLNRKVKLIRTIAPSESKAFQLFEVLNDRGRSLEPLDLIKTYF